MADPIKPHRPVRPDASSVSKTPRPTPGLMDLLRQMVEAVDERASSRFPEGTLLGVVPDVSPRGPLSGVASRFPRAGNVVDGRLVRKDVPNVESISAYFDDWDELPGVREIPMSEFPGLTGRHYSVEGDRRIAELAEQIRQSGELNPLIVAADAEGPWVMEGAHRIEALKRLGAKSFPAIFAMDKKSPWVPK